MATLPEMAPVKSSNVEAIGHAGDELFVRFKSGGTYIYSGVSAAMHKLVMEADSIGKFVASEIRGKYESRKHDEPTDDAGRDLKERADG